MDAYLSFLSRSNRLNRPVGVARCIGEYVLVVNFGLGPLDFSASDSELKLSVVKAYILSLPAFTPSGSPDSENDLTPSTTGTA